MPFSCCAAKIPLVHAELIKTMLMIMIMFSVMDSNASFRQI